MIGPRLYRILLVDDDPDIGVIARFALENIGGFKVEISSSGMEGIKTAQTFDPDLILLDVMMPGLDGMSTLKALQQIPRTASIPVVFLTAKVQPHQVELYRHLGAIDVIPKPFDPIQLSSILNAIWERHGDRSATGGH